MGKEDVDPADQFMRRILGDNDPVSQCGDGNYKLIDRQNWWAWIACDTADIVDLGECR